jgi:hypothetical protein
MSPTPHSDWLIGRATRQLVQTVQNKRHTMQLQCRPSH